MAQRTSSIQQKLSELSLDRARLHNQIHSLTSQLEQANQQRDQLVKERDQAQLKGINQTLQLAKLYIERKWLLESLEAFGITAVIDVDDPHQPIVLLNVPDIKTKPGEEQ